MQFKNTQKISKIVFSPKEPSHCLCPLGQLFCDKTAKKGKKALLPHYTNNFTIEFTPGEVICDYLDVEDWIRENIDNETLTIEDSVAMLYGYLETTYKPAHLKVTSDVYDALHGPATVTKETPSYLPYDIECLENLKLEPADYME